MKRRWRDPAPSLATQCSVTGCVTIRRALGMCDLHYVRWKKHGTTDGRPSEPFRMRFWRQVKKQDGDGCWEWVGTIKGNGYGQIKHAGRSKSTHRVSYELEYGPVPDGLVVRHRCDNRRCVRPTHLTAGSQAQNIRDMHERDRAPRGDRHGCARLTTTAVMEMRHRFAAGETALDLAPEFGVAHNTAWAAITGKTWRHLDVVT